jgi:hypothetical protein
MRTANNNTEGAEMNSNTVKAMVGSVVEAAAGVECQDVTITRDGKAVAVVTVYADGDVWIAKVNEEGAAMDPKRV